MAQGDEVLGDPGHAVLVGRMTDPAPRMHGVDEDDGQTPQTRIPRSRRRGVAHLDEHAVHPALAHEPGDRVDTRRMASARASSTM